MREATLIVSRIEDKELRFVLQYSQASRPAVMEARTVLRPDQRENISHAFEDFANCLEGFHADEPKFRELGQVLFLVVVPQPIQIQLRALDIPLTILTDDPTLPWEILHDGDEFLSLKLPIARQLIIHEQMAGLLRPPQSDKEGFSALVISDPTGDLPGAAEEGKALGEFFREKGRCDLLLGAEATWREIQRRLVSRTYSVIHFCGHVDYDPAERLSSIRLQGGHRLSADEVLPTFKGSPVVFLNACYSDFRLETQTASSRAESFAQAFMLGSERGVAAAVVGTMWRIPDEPEEAGREFSLAFYRCLLEGRSIGDAMRVSRAMARERLWGPMVWGPYVLYGDPCLEPFEEYAPQIASSEATDPAQEEESTHEPPSASKPQVTKERERPSANRVIPFEEELEGAKPLDTVARRVFHVALREMRQMEQGALGSMHLLIGLCESKVEILRQVLQQYNIDEDKVCTMARKRARELIPSKEQDFGISMNVARTLVFASRRVKLLGKEKISGEDLLAGLLKCEESEAIGILESFNIFRGELLKLLVASSEPLKCQFDGPIQEAMEHAVRCAQQARLDFLGTPHLLIGLIRTGGLRTITLIRERGLNIEQLCETLKAGVGKGVSTAGNRGKKTSPPLTERCYLVLQRAHELANDAGEDEIAEIHLLRAILEEQHGFTHRVLRKMNADPKKMLVGISDIEVLSRGLLRSLNVTPDELLSALQRHRKQGNE